MISTEAGGREWLSVLPEFDALALERLERLVALLTAENSRQNLVSAASLQHVWQRHIVDSAQLLRFVPRGPLSPWLDLGTGAGFPGLVISTLRPELPVIMVESRARRVEWLNHAIESLGLRHANVLGQRIELVPTQSVGVVSARAFAPLDRLLDLSFRFSTGDTLWLLPKGRSARDEVEGLSGWSHMFHVEQSLTDPDAGIVVGTVAGRQSATTSKRKR